MTIDTSTIEIPRAELDRHAFEQTMRNLLPMPFVVASFPIFVTVVARGSVVGARAAVWVAWGVLAALLFSWLHWRHRRGPVVEPTRGFLVLLDLALVAAALVYGTSTWVVTAGSNEMIVVCALFPVIAGVVGALTLAGRPRRFLVFLVPLVASTCVGLLMAGDTMLEALAVVLLAYGAAMWALYQVVTRSAIAHHKVRVHTERLVEMLVSERTALTEVNEQLSQTNERLAHLAVHDSLTGLLNRRGTLDVIERELAASPAIALLFCDLDHFKAVNDGLGHRGGDQFLIVLADRIIRTLDAGAETGRMGGDEFVIVLPGSDAVHAVSIAERLVAVLGQSVRLDGNEVPSSVSIGVAVGPDHGTTSGDLLRTANEALHAAKRAGRNRVELFDGDLGSAHQREQQVVRELRRALDHGEIQPFFQPEIDATSGRVVGAEVLARWLRRDGAVVNAGDFLALAARSGMLERLTERTLQNARPVVRRLVSLGLPDGFRFRINLGPASTDRGWRADQLHDLVRGLDPSILTVDVKESAVSVDVPAAAGTLASFRARGGRVCLDDFGRGTSSLNLLRRLPIDEVRIDRQASDSVTAHPHDRAIVRSIISLAREIDLAVTAEGVETGAQADALIALGCVHHQGHLYAPALPADRFERFLVERLAEGQVQADLPAGEWDTGELD